uniref:Uncharacterized protein n=1 Tax=Candidatus Kentrum sp. LFY TaxID=2126342 RepID=A0A450WI62_9GAMM|nr:MAG: Protein of unknown function (DUF2590) [Candidatus Kentron sp. LFY]
MGSSNDIDLRITDDDLDLDGIREPRLITERDCIAQDIAHMIREKGYAIQMLGERNPIIIESLIQSIEKEMDEDKRIIPGTSKLVLRGTGVFYATGDTVAYGPVEVTIPIEKP